MADFCFALRGVTRDFLLLPRHACPLNRSRLARNTGYCSPCGISEWISQGAERRGSQGGNPEFRRFSRQSQTRLKGLELPKRMPNFRSRSPVAGKHTRAPDFGHKKSAKAPESGAKSALSRIDKGNRSVVPTISSFRKMWSLRSSARQPFVFPDPVLGFGQRFFDFVRM